LVKDNLRSSGLPFHVSIEKSYCCKNCKCYPKQIQPLTQLPQNLSESKGYNYISMECQNPTNRSAKHNLDNKKKHTDNTSAKWKCYHIGIEIRYFRTGSHKFSESIILLILHKCMSTSEPHDVAVDVHSNICLILGGLFRIVNDNQLPHQAIWMWYKKK
jgi:hypothetical protein